MPAGLIEDEDRVRAIGDFSGDLIEMKLLAIARRGDCGPRSPPGKSPASRRI